MGPGKYEVLSCNRFYFNIIVVSNDETKVVDEGKSHIVTVS